MHPFIVLSTIFVVCVLGLVISQHLAEKRINNHLRKQQKRDRDLQEARQHKVDYISRSLGFNPYTVSKVSQVFNKLAEKSNIDIRHYLVYQYINDNNIPGGLSPSDALPVDKLYEILTMISHRQILIFKYR